MRKRTAERTRTVIEEATLSEEGNGVGQASKVAMFYKCGMDTERIDSQGLAPLEEELAKIDALTDPSALPEVLARLHRIGIPALFEVRVFPDMTDASRQAVYVGQSGLGLPGKSFYFDENDRFAKIRAEYGVHIARMLAFALDESGPAGKIAGAVYSFETELARLALANQDLRAYMPSGTTETSQLQASVRVFDWPRYFEALGAPGVKAVILLPDSYFAQLDSLLAGTSTDVLRNYLKWHLLRGTADHLSGPIRAEAFRFYGKVMRGQQTPRSRKDLMIDETNRALGDLVGKLFIKKYFSAQTRVRVQKLVDNVKAVLKQRIEGQTWMSDTARETALRKLENMVFIIGHDDYWIDYASLEIGCGAHLANILRAREFHFARTLADLSKPVHRDRFPFPPQTVMGAYSKGLNSIVLTAGFLQPPIFDPDVDEELNYGCLGAAIGHELTHGFDDLGRQFDETGKLRPWWTDSDTTAFKRLVAPLVEQFDSYQVADGVHVNGTFTLGENLADT